jgi:hypothetical protein
MYKKSIENCVCPEKKHRVYYAENRNLQETV